MRLLLLVLFAVSLTGCAIAPFSEPYTARTVPVQKTEWGINVGSPGYVSGRMNHGATEKLEIGGIVEYQVFSLLVGLNAKYNLTEADNDSPFSLMAGAGFGSNSKYGYVGAIKSIQVNPKYELAFNVRYNVFNWDLDDPDDEEDSQDFIDTLVGSTLEEADGTHSYISADISNTFWFGARFGMTLSIGGISFIDEADSDIGFKAGLGFNFRQR